MINKLVSQIITKSEINSKALDEVAAEPSVTEEKKKVFIKKFGLTKLHMSTVYCWMYTLEFHFKNFEKHYFVDEHKKDETLACHRVFTKASLDYEYCAYCWGPWYISWILSL